MKNGFTFFKELIDAKVVKELDISVDGLKCWVFITTGGGYVGEEVTETVARAVNQYWYDTRKLYQLIEMMDVGDKIIHIFSDKIGGYGGYGILPLYDYNFLFLKKHIEIKNTANTSYTSLFIKDELTYEQEDDKIIFTKVERK